MAVASKGEEAKPKVQFSTRVRGASQVIEHLENLPVRNLRAAMVEKPSARFHELQIHSEDANWIITHYVYPRQRNVSLAWAVELGSLIDSGDLLPTTIHFAHCKEDGRAYLVDGYHRLAGCAMAKRPMLFPVEHHWCENMKEVDRVYARLDQGAPRTVHAAIRATGYDQSVGIAEQRIPKIAAAAAVIKHNFRQPRSVEAVRSASRKLDMVEEWVYEGRLFAESLAGGNAFITSKLWNAANLAVGLVVYRYAPEKADAFFRPVANMACEDGSAQQALLSNLINRGDKKASVGERCRIVANAWNAFYEGRAIARALVQDPGRPIDILGTPWAGPTKVRSGVNKGQTTDEQHYREVSPAPRPSVGAAA